MSRYDEYMIALQRRLKALAAAPPYVWVNTDPERVEEYARVETDFGGYSEDDIAAIEKECALPLPSAFRAYLRAFCVRPGRLLKGSDLARRGMFASFRANAEIISDRTLPDEAIVFLIHQGYSFDYFLATREEDPAVRRFDPTKGDRVFARSFTAYLEKDVAFSEQLRDEQHRNGGSFAQILSDLTLATVSRGNARPTLRHGAGAHISHPDGVFGACDDEAPWEW
jgi:hypothetical protein